LELNDYQRHLYHVIAPVGGVFDFYTGRVKLPPKWIQKMGLIFSTAFSGTAAPFAAPLKYPGEMRFHRAGATSTVRFFCCA